MSRTISLLALCLMTAGCVPMRFAYMEPSATAGTVSPRRPVCGGPSDTITFSPMNLATPDLIQVRLRAEPPSGTIPGQLLVRLEIRKNVHEPFSMFSSIEKQHERSANYFALMNLPVNIEFAADTIPLSWADGGHVVWRLSLPGGARRWVMTDERLLQQLFVPEFSGDWLDAQLPTISFDGKALAFPPVRFRAGSSIFIMPINC